VNNRQIISQLVVLPIERVIVFPKLIKPLLVTPLATAVIQHITTENIPCLIFPHIELNQPAPIGTLVMLQESPTLDFATSVIVQGSQRVRVMRVVETTPYLVYEVETLTDDLQQTPELRAMMRATITLFRRVVSLNEDLSGDLVSYAHEIEHAGELADYITSAVQFSFPEQKEVLETLPVRQRLMLVSTLLSKEITAREIERELAVAFNHQLDSERNSSTLSSDLRNLQRLKSENDVLQQEFDSLQQQITDAKLPPSAHDTALRELRRLSLMPPMAPEISLIHHYIDWLVNLPWHQMSVDSLDLNHAEAILNQQHYGLKKVKERILEHIAVRKLGGDQAQMPILCFYGAPGIGKTSIAKSIADALGRSFFRLSMGGIRDEAEIRGHRRTYLGSLPGRIIQTMRRSQTINPVILLDEVDKMVTEFQGDPSSALLEVLDPQQNKQFHDHFLGVPYDLSRVIFIATVNDLDNLSPALEDRLEVIEFEGYMDQEKEMIAQTFLIPRQLKAHGIQDVPIHIEKSALKKIIREYTYEAGVRNLDRRIAQVLRKVTRQIAQGETATLHITPHQVEKLLGAPEFLPSRVNRQDAIGIVTGLAWTSNGGDAMTIEVLVVPGKGNLLLTGQLGEVMQESAQAALSYMRSRADHHQVPHQDFENYDVHVHLPEGSTPKEGPSAGVAIAIGIVSAFTERAVRADFACTGEITLHGRVLAVGGIREKVLAAQRNEISQIILPLYNKPDLVDVPKDSLKNRTLHLVDTLDEVIELALLPPPEERTRDKNRQEQEDEADNDAEA